LIKALQKVDKRSALRAVIPVASADSAKDMPTQYRNLTNSATCASGLSARAASFRRRRRGALNSASSAVYVRLITATHRAPSRPTARFGPAVGPPSSVSPPRAVRAKPKEAAPPKSPPRPTRYGSATGRRRVFGASTNPLGPGSEARIARNRRSFDVARMESHGRQCGSSCLRPDRINVSTGTVWLQGPNARSPFRVQEDEHFDVRR